LRSDTLDLSKSETVLFNVENSTEGCFPNYYQKVV
jgi:hypothetical protein